MSRGFHALVLLAAMSGEPTRQHGVTGCHHDVHASLSILAHNQSQLLCSILDSTAFLGVTDQQRHCQVAASCLVSFIQQLPVASVLLPEDSRAVGHLGSKPAPLCWKLPALARDFLRYPL